jgi:glycosyltransferase involved in cell wall biosynthesis
LSRTLDSLLAAEVPAGFEVRVTVVDNNSKDATRQTVEDYKERFGGRLYYVFEGRQGRSFALNAGIRSTGGELIGMIDDDEEIDADWYRLIDSIFSLPEVDFIGGPYVPRWSIEPPVWLPMNYLGAIGWVDGGDRIVPFDKNYPGMLMGGNAVLTRAILNKVGLYDTRLGRTDKRLLAGEDDDMYRRLLAAGARGFYVPDLIIYHYIPRERLAKSYFRRWCFWRGVSSGLIDRERRMPVAYLGGIPRFLYGEAARGLLKILARAFGKRAEASQIFSSELAIWDMAGFFYGKHFYKPPKYPLSETTEIVEPDAQQTCSE